jgi:hypothetical protein
LAVERDFAGEEFEVQLGKFDGGLSANDKHGLAKSIGFVGFLFTDDDFREWARPFGERGIPFLDGDTDLIIAG